MNKNESVTAEKPVITDELANMCLIDRREWWLWSSAISVTVLLTMGIASFAVPAVLSGFDSFHVFFVDRAVRGLWGLVVVFNIYVVYEQIQINRIRHEFADGLYKMAVLDPVTSMFNRRYIMSRLRQEIARSQRNGSPLTVIVFDLDRFKEINDEHGHAIGDYVLRIFGEQLKRATRGSDVVARYGGDEFMALLPECTIEQIQAVLYRLDGLHVKTSKSKIHIRYSAGWTDYICGEPPDDCLKRADEMLYTNKHNHKRLFVTSIVAE